MPLPGPSPAVAAALSRHADGRRWLRELPALVAEFAARWELVPGVAFEGGSCSWAAPVRRREGGEAVLKLSWPHPEARGEAAALRHWAGRGAVRLLAADPPRYALLLERCTPGTTLRETPLPAADRLRVGAALLTGLWAAPGRPPSCVPELAAVCAGWADLAEDRYRAHAGRLSPATDPGVVRLGAALLRELPRTAARSVLLHGDLNPGNVLAARRGPWLAIDPKPMVGDPAYDPWPLISQCAGARPGAGAGPGAGPTLAERFACVADLTGEPHPRLAAWALARTVEYALWSADAGNHGEADRALVLARSLPPLADR